MSVGICNHPQYTRAGGEGGTASSPPCASPAPVRAPARLPQLSPGARSSPSPALSVLANPAGTEMAVPTPQPPSGAETDTQHQPPSPNSCQVLLLNRHRRCHLPEIRLPKSPLCCVSDGPSRGHGVPSGHGSQVCDSWESSLPSDWDTEKDGPRTSVADKQAGLVLPAARPLPCWEDSSWRRATPVSWGSRNAWYLPSTVTGNTKLHSPQARAAPALTPDTHLGSHFSPPNTLQTLIPGSLQRGTLGEAASQSRLVNCPR